MSDRPDATDPKPEKTHAEIYYELEAFYKEGRLREAGPEHLKLYGRFLAIGAVVGFIVSTVAGGVFIMAGWFFIEGAVERDAALDALLERGARIQAEVTDQRIVRETHFNEISPARATTHVYTHLTYRFETPDGRTVEGEAEAPESTPKLIRVSVHYMPDDPHFHALSAYVEQDRSGFDWSLGGLIANLMPIILMAAGAACIIGINWFLWRKIRQYRALPNRLANRRSGRTVE